MSLAINDLQGLRQDDPRGTLKFGNFTVAGRLSRFREAWNRITTNRWVLEIVSNGNALPFLPPPPMAKEPLENPLTVIHLKREALSAEVQSLLDKGAIEEIPLGKQEGGGGITRTTSLRPKRQAAFVPFSISGD